MKKTALRIILCSIAGFAAVCAQAQTPARSALDDRHAVTLDIDRDGKPDGAELLRNFRTNELDLVIRPSSWNDNPRLSRRLAVTKPSIAAGLVLDFIARGNSLIVTTGCGGCSNDVSTTLTIVYRSGTFVVGGYTQAWETRTSSGTCDVNFLTGKGTLVRDGGKVRALRGKFTPIKLDEWSEEKRPKECE
jgi:hypothetical protein